MDRYKRFHFIGIGGIGMSGIARILLKMGYVVTGSDLTPTHITKNLVEQGATIYEGHNASNIDGVDAVVMSTAIPETNIELKEAIKRGIPIIQRAQILGMLMKDKLGIAIAGTHGKTTTTSMVAAILKGTNLDPTVIIGGEYNDIGSNAILGSDNILVAEACESDGSFLELFPNIAIVTNIDADINPGAKIFADLNFNYEKTINKVKDLFLNFIHLVPQKDGKVILCLDNDNVKDIMPNIKRNILTYGIESDADMKAVDIQFSNYGSTCTIIYKNNIVGKLNLKVPGLYNILNALAALLVGLEFGKSFNDMTEVMSNFEGARRRFQVIGKINNVMIVDDYAHNPSKIKAALSGAATGNPGRIVAIFQPHRYTRTKLLLSQFPDAFDNADVLIATKIYSAGEKPIFGNDGASFESILLSEIKKKNNKTEIVYIENKEEIIPYIMKIMQAGDLYITLGAGDITKLSHELFKKLSTC